jgi:plasmid stabilization system protein ParE
MYKLLFLPRALGDINAITHYISIDLEAPMAARRLKKDIADAAADLTKNPLRHRVYIAQRKLQLEYRKMRVKNYSVFYVVKDNLVEIHRVLYSRRNISSVLQDE